MRRKSLVGVTSASHGANKQQDQLRQLQVSIRHPKLYLYHRTFDFAMLAYGSYLLTAEYQAQGLNVMLRPNFVEVLGSDRNFRRNGQILQIPNSSATKASEKGIRTVIVCVTTPITVSNF